MSYNSKYFDRKPGSLENAVLEALGGQINEASMDVNLDDDKRFIQNIEKMKVKVKILSRATSGRGRVDVRLTGSKNDINKVVDRNQTSMRSDNDFAFNESTEVVEAKMDKVNPTAAKKKFDDRKDKDIDNDGDVDSSDKYLHKRRKAIGKAMSKEEKDDFRTHMMYDPKTGKEVTAKTPEDHEKYSKMGYTHDKPKMEGLEDSPNPANSQHLCAKNVVHEEWGEGQCVPTMHADPDADGNVAWYDVMFEHGIEKGVLINELKVTHAESHHHGKKKKVSEEVDLDEGKMKELAGKIASVYKKMKSDSKMKPFADKFRADVKKSLNIRKSLEKVLPDYVGGGDITKLMSEGKLDELSPALLKRARDAAAAKKDKLDKRQDALSTKKGGGYNFDSKSGQKLAKDADKARDQEKKFSRGARDAGERDTEKAFQKGVLGKKGTSAKSVEKSRRKDAADAAGPGREKGSVGGVDRNIQKGKDAYTKYKEKGGGLSRSDYMKKFGSRLKREATELGTPERTKHTLDVTPGQSMEDWNKAVGVMQEKNNTMREVLAKMWGVEEGKNYNPFNTEEKVPKGYHRMPDGSLMKDTDMKDKKEQKTMTGQPVTKVSVDPDMKEKKNIA